MLYTASRVSHCAACVTLYRLRYTVRRALQVVQFHICNPELVLRLHTPFSRLHALGAGQRAMGAKPDERKVQYAY